MKFSLTWPITTDGSDCKGRVSLPYLCSLLQESATLHADQLGWGYDDLESQGLQWVLSRQWISLARIPRWKEKIIISTWPSGKGGITWNRDFLISDTEGRELGRAASLWFVMDRKTRRPRPAKIGAEMTFDNVERVRESDLKPLPAPESPEKGGRIRMGFHDIDMHDHVNNLRYLTWMLDGLSFEFQAANRCRELEINFLAEGFIGDEAEVCTASIREKDNESVVLQSLSRMSDGAEMCRMRTMWESDS